MQTLDLGDIDTAIGLFQQLLLGCITCGKVEVEVADAVVARAVTGAFTACLLSRSLTLSFSRRLSS
jgi:hypothetical protein